MSRAGGFVKEFREFAARGNVVDLAVGVVIGGAFGQITSSLVNDIFMPVFGALFGNMDFSYLKIVLRPLSETEAGITPEVAIYIGNFLSVCINFLLVAFAMFLLVKGINTMRRKAEAVKEQPPEPAPAAPPAPSPEETLLAEIRDLLRDGARKGD